MSDKELLELAAKAVGMHVKAQRVDADDKFTHLVVGQKFKPEKIDWNPLTDDGAALRLAVALRLKIIPGKYPGNGCTVEAQRSGIAGCTAFRDDKHEQMRHAIVRVAAEIGKAMP